jgi:hypothetical protein
MKRRIVTPRRIIGGSVGLALAAVLGLSLAPDVRANASGAPPSTLNHIAAANQRAAAVASAQLRDRSAASAAAADSLRAAEERGRDQAEADMRRADADGL